MHSALARIRDRAYRTATASAKLLFKSLALCAAMVFAAITVLAIHNYSTCAPVSSDEQAFEIAKKFLLEDGSKKLLATDGNASIFEGSLTGNYFSCNDAPPRYSSITKMTATDERRVEFIDCERHYAAVVYLDAYCGRPQFFSAGRFPNWERMRPAEIHREPTRAQPASSFPSP